MSMADNSPIYELYAPEECSRRCRKARTTAKGSRRKSRLRKQQGTKAGRVWPKEDASTERCEVSAASKQTIAFFAAGGGTMGVRERRV